MFRNIALSYRAITILLLLAALLGCGGSGSKAPPTATIPTSGGGTNSPAAPAIVQVAAGQTASGAGINVPAPTGTPPNAQDLGVAQLTGGASAFNTGDIIHRGATMRVILFGPGLSSDMQVSILGPNDIQISNVQSTVSAPPDSTPGVSFTAAVASNAGLGARSVVLQSSNGNITTFTGGLEVVP